MMTISAISPATVHVVLDYLRPLSGPLPPHLVSTPLLQRHHFLGLSPDSPVDYLAWPSPDQSHAVQLLQEGSASPHDPPILVHYLPDPEYFQAHVRITSELRLVFLWDKYRGWQYHNVALMPFPPNSYATIDDALSGDSPDDFLPEQSQLYITKEDEDDSYWNAYGLIERDGSDHQISAGHIDSKTSSEDAYWAQYSNVQGSGDSTLPSPLPPKIENTRVIVPSDDLRTNHIEPYNPLEPPSPAALARRLEALSTQNGALSSLSEDGPSDALIPSISVPALASTPSTSSPSKPPSLVFDQGQRVAIADDSGQHALRDSIKSLYRLWKVTRPDLSAEQAQKLFLINAHRVLEEF